MVDFSLLRFEPTSVTMKRMAKSQGKKQTDAVLISFKIGKELYDELEQYAKTQRDEAGFAMSASQTARRLVIEALKSRKK